MEIRAIRLAVLLSLSVMTAPALAQTDEAKAAGEAFSTRKRST